MYFSVIDNGDVVLNKADKNLCCYRKWFIVCLCVWGMVAKSKVSSVLEDYLIGEK